MKSVLVVGSSRGRAVALADTLRVAGSEPDVCSTRTEARRRFKRRQFCAVLLEVRLRDGFAYSLIDAFCRRGAVVVVLTRFGSPAGQRDARARGATAYLASPAKRARVLAGLGGERECDFDDPPLSLRERSWDALCAGLSECNWCIARAAPRLRISVRSLQRHLRSPPQTRGAEGTYRDTPVAL
jgi:ActR/RegA family two-component response regulator